MYSRLGNSAVCYRRVSSFLYFIFCVLTVCVITSCGAGSSDNLDINMDAVNILPEAFEGCRGPEDLGCESCCNGENSVLSANCTGDECVATWYNVSGSGYCGDIPLCASCSYRDEEELFDLVVPDSCEDCSSITIGIDACFYPSSCECLCSRQLSLSASCPTE